VTEKNGIALTGKAQLTPTNRWQQYILTLPGIKTGYGKLVMLFECQGAVDLDGINLMVTNTIGRINPNLYEHFLISSISRFCHSLVKGPLIIL